LQKGLRIPKPFSRFYLGRARESMRSLKYMMAGDMAFQS